MMRGGAFTASPVISRPASAVKAENGDPKVAWLFILLLVTTVILTVGYIAVYAGVQYGVPSWGAHAYPPPLTP
jgi:hypothetical protein